MNTLVDAVYVINLERRPGRLQAITKRCQRHNITFTRLNATDGTREAVKRAYNNVRTVLKAKKQDHWNLKGANHYACLLSHVRAYQDALLKGYKRIAVFEDDVMFHKAFESMLTKVAQKLPQDWDLLYLGCSTRLAGKSTQTICYRTTHAIWGAFAYLLNARVMKRLVKLALPHPHSTTDAWLLPHIIRDTAFKTFVCRPPLCIADVTVSDLRKGRAQSTTRSQFGWQLQNYD